MFAQAVEKMSIKQKMNEYLCKMFGGNSTKVFYSCYFCCKVFAVE